MAQTLCSLIHVFVDNLINGAKSLFRELLDYYGNLYN
jgi:hypothetical protein